MASPAQRLLSEFARDGAVDVTCHLGHWPFRLRASASAADLRAYAGRHGLRELWVSHLSALVGFDTRTGNAAALSECGEDPTFRVLAVVNPSDGAWEQELDWALANGAAGVRIAPAYHGYALPDAARVAHACRERGRPLQVLVRLDDARVRHPRFDVRDPRLDEIAAFLRATIGTSIVLSGLRWDEWLELSAHLADSPARDVLLDLWHINGPFRVADLLGNEPERWVFGSGFPVQTPEATILQLAASDLSSRQRAAIAHGNAARLLGGRVAPPI
jgi:predicted TIM-barrel fold metal-dependent hydrolase